MKKFIFYAALLFASPAANAAVVHVATRPIEMGGGASSLVFGFDGLGRAWVEEKDENGYSRDSAVSRLRFPVPGLRFDPGTAEINYGPVVCAHVVPMAAGYSVFKTGRCRLGSIVATRPPTGARIETIIMTVP